MTGALELRPDDSNVMLAVPNVRLEAGKTYTIVIVARVENGAETRDLRDRGSGDGRSCSVAAVEWVTSAKFEENDNEQRRSQGKVRPGEGQSETGNRQSYR